MNSLLSLSHLTKTYAGQAEASVKNLSLELPQGQILSFLGPSGCGKTTTLRLIAGHEVADSGVVRIGESVLSGPRHFVPPQRRPIAMVFQDLALFPHLCVKKNILFGVSHLHPREQKKRLDSLVDMLKISALLERSPREISGGQKQRVALARAIITHPQLLLLDEPFSALDTQTRLSLREELISHLKKLNMTSVFVLHDQEDAFAISHLVLLMEKGEHIECASPQDLCLRPQMARTARFLGHWLELPIESFCTHRIKTALFGELELHHPPKHQGEHYKLYLRPEAFCWKQKGYQAIIEKTTLLGQIQKITLNKDGQRFHTFVGPTMNFQKQQKVSFGLEPRHMILLKQ